MKRKAWALLAVCACFLAAAGETVPQAALRLVPVMPPPWKWHDQKASYVEASHVQIGCRTPALPDVQLKWTWTFLEGNPISRDANVTVDTVSRFVLQPRDARDIFLTYDSRRLVKLVRVKCVAMNVSSKVQIDSKAMLVEQLYWTSQTVIQDDQQQVVEDLALEAGDTRLLRCVADGNPSPRVRWFQETKRGILQLTTNETQIVVKQDAQISLKKVQCWAQNHIMPDTEWIHSPWVTARAPPDAQPWPWLPVLTPALLLALMAWAPLQGDIFSFQ